MQAVNTQVDGRTFSRFDDFFFHLLGHFGYHFFDTCWMDTSVGYELMQGQAADFPTYGVECRNDNGFGSVVHDDFHARGSLQCTDVASFTADDTSFHFIVVDMEYGHAVFNGRFRCYALYALYDDAFGFLVGCQFGFIHDFIDVACRVGLGFVFQGFYQAFACFVGTQPADGFQFFAFFGFQFLQLFFATRQSLLLVFQPFTVGFYFAFFTVQVVLTLVQAQFALFQAVFVLLYLLVALLHFLFQFRLLVQELFFHFEQFFLFDDFGFFARFFDNLPIFTRCHIAE